MPVDFTNIKTTRGREYEEKMISRLNDSLMTIPPLQRSAILGSVIEESGGNPLAKSENGTYQGLLQWGADRYRIQSDNPEEEFVRQLNLIRNTLNDTVDGKSWTHGGTGSGYNSYKEAYNAFHHGKDLKDVYRGFSYGYVRPAGKEDSYENRLKVSEQVLNRIAPSRLPIVTATDEVQHVEYPDAIGSSYKPQVQNTYRQTINALNALDTKRVLHRLDEKFAWRNQPESSRFIPENAASITKSEGGSLKRKMWNDLSLTEKAEMMKVAILNGITSLPEIKEKYNEFASGGSIHIKPENRGKFTALKERTGHSATWFKEHGTPAQKKMATFALNAKHWKHGLGGNLFAPGGELDEEYQYATTILPEVPVTPTKLQREQAWRNREGNIAKSLVSHPTLPNLFSAAEHYANSIPGLFSAPSEITGVTASEPLLPDVKNAAQLMKAGKVARAIEDAVKTGKNSFRTAVSNIFKKPAKKPDIIWDAKQMFKNGNNFSYTQKDIDILNSFIPEYKEIEKLSKANGTYLKMPDGSTWKGDPREWVIAQSKNVKANYGNEILTHGNSDSWITKEGTDVTGDILGEKTLWTSTNPYLGGTYGNKRYRFVVPKDAKVETVADAHGRYWRDVKPGVDTNMMVYPNLIEDKIIRINNVVDRGPNDFFKEELPKAFPKEGVIDYTARVFQGDDLVLGNKVRRKALLGNNGMFDINNPNIFKGLIPAGFGIAGYKYSKSNENK